MMCGPTWNSWPLPIACDLLGTQKPPYIYEIPTLCTLGVRPAILSLMNCRKTGSKQPGSSCGEPGRPGRHVHWLEPLKNEIFPSRRRRPVEQRRVFGDEFGTGA